ncbi:hypothetical protein AXG93_4347s1030 [Marchantia polymorpha subsp. ruderalis]|uniref:Uncharacterized protein n=1 Tax=Marchantia polymorpha subsp. ruderalis TaxID=1480154 RepID=A0A176WQ16_MARPO|nr:hypothetical protein AXG93_4347s1030 [Marchantia polymorpha subsp. ruderalis]
MKKIQENIGNLFMIFDFDGTLAATNRLVAAGAGLGEKDGAADEQLGQRAGGCTGEDQYSLPTCSSWAFGWTTWTGQFAFRRRQISRVSRSITQYLSARRDQNLSLVMKNGGFAVKFTDEDGRLAKAKSSSASRRMVS